MIFQSRFVLSRRSQQLAGVHAKDLAFFRDTERLRGVLDAVERIKGKSRSFWIASIAFEGRLKVDLLLL